MAPARKFTSAFGAAAMTLSVLMTGAGAQDVSSTQTCETASLNSTPLTPPSFAQEDFVAISETLDRLGLLEGEIIDDLLQKSVEDPEIYDAQREIVMEYRYELEKHLSGEYAEADSFDDYNLDILSGFAAKLENYLTVLESLYADNADVMHAFTGIAANRESLRQSNQPALTNRTGMASCQPDALPDPGRKNYGAHVPALALS